MRKDFEAILDNLLPDDAHVIESLIKDTQVEKLPELCFLISLPLEEMITYQDHPQVSQEIKLNWTSMIVLIKLRETIAIAQDRASVYAETKVEMKIQ